MSPGFNWQALTVLLLRLSQVAMEWYKLIEGDQNGINRARKVTSVILDPDRPEEEIDDVPEGRDG